jgi:hypothetical protein
VGFDAHNAHQPLRVFAIDPQLDGHLPAPEEWTFQVQLVELAHQPQVVRALWLRLVVEGRARYSQQFALLSHGESRMSGVDPWTFVFSR